MTPKLLIQPFGGLAVLTLALLLAGCGGGGSGSSVKFVSNPDGGGEGGDAQAADSQTALVAGLDSGADSGPQAASNPDFAVTTGPNGGVIGGVNVPLTLFFNAPVSPVDSEGQPLGVSAIQIVSIHDPVGDASAPAGLVPSLIFEAVGSRVIITPTVNFNSQQVTYGFTGDALYEISFTNPAQGPAIMSAAGEPIENWGDSFFFRTPDAVYDFTPGYPRARAFFVTDALDADFPSEVMDGDSGQAVDGDLTAEVLALYASWVEIRQLSPPLTVPISPINDVIFIFSDGVIPQTVLNTSDGTSPAVTLSYNAAPDFVFNSKVTPADLLFAHQQSNMTVVGWKSQLAAYPPGGLLLASVSSSVADLAGNTKAQVTGNSSPDLSVTMRVVGSTDYTCPDLDGDGTHDCFIVEPFDNKFNEDTLTTSADWAGNSPGQLGPVLGGGTGVDGTFFIDTLGTNQNPATSRIPTGTQLDFDTRTVYMPTVKEVAPGVFEPRRYNFESVTLPPLWTLTVLTDRDRDGVRDPREFLVQSPGHPLDGRGAPLAILSTGDILIEGTVDVSGPHAQPPETPQTSASAGFLDYRGEGGRGTEPLTAAGTGGRGGDTLLLDQDGNIAIPLQSPIASPPFQPSDGRLVGVTGRSNALGAYSLTDPVNDLSILNTDPVLSELMVAGEILLQPNVGIGSSLAGNSGTRNEAIDENHPTFVLESVSVVGSQTTLTVASGPDDPRLDQPSLNIGQAPIATTGDSYLIGRLGGGPGDDAATFDRQGEGSGPYVVVNEGALGITTTTGGGGGGGAFEPGVDGESSGPASNPTVNQRGGSGGISQNEAAGASRGLGAIRGFGRVVSGNEFDVLSQAGGRSLDGLTGDALDGSMLVPNSSADGWIFEVTAFDGMRLTVARIQQDDVDIGLTDLPGPALPPGSEVDFTLLPPLDIGGAGGGGTGVSVTGTVNYAPDILTRLKPGAAGAAGGGSLRLETAGLLRVLATARILARGGRGGVVNDLQGIYAGGGGGGGGNALLRGQQMQLLLGSLISVAGGEGGGLSGFGRGGRGGAGYIRLENGADTLDPEVLSQVTDPALGEINVGRAIAEARGLGQSRFLQTVVANPEYDRVEVTWTADTNGDQIADGPFTWSFDDNGVAGDFVDPPFQLQINSVPVDNQGFLNATAIYDGFLLASDLVSARTGLAYDPVTDTILYVVGRGTWRIERLDPATGTAVGFPFVLDPSLATQFNPLNVVSLAVAPEFGREFFMLERGTGDILVVDSDIGVLKRRISVPFETQGPLAYFPEPADRLILVDNVNDRLLIIPTADPDAAEPQTDDFGIIDPIATIPVVRDGEILDIEFTGIAYDESTQTLWAVDSFNAVVMQIDMAPGQEGISTSGVHAFAPLESDGATALPSSIAFDGTSLHLVHATDPLDCRIQPLAPASISTIGAPLELTTFGTLLPQGASSQVDGELYLRFRVQFTGPPAGATTPFDRVRIDEVSFEYENKPF